MEREREREREVGNAVEPWGGKPADCLWGVPVYSVPVLFLPCVQLYEGFICLACPGLSALSGLWVLINFLVMKRKENLF